MPEEKYPQPYKVVQLHMNSQLATNYKNRSQQARVVSEDWGSKNLYCLACDKDFLEQRPNNTRVFDYVCNKCSSSYQLKSSIHWSETRIPDAAYETMIHAIKTDSTPNLFVMQYCVNWMVRNLLLIPSFFFTVSAIEKRKPLSINARRAGWVGCNILLMNIAPEGKIKLVDEGRVIDFKSVRNSYNLVRPFSELSSKMRGWTLDVFRILRGLGQLEFSLDDVYSFEQTLSELYPNNKYIRAKIRQQLQVLRDLGFVQFLGKGRYLLIKQ